MTQTAPSESCGGLTLVEIPRTGPLAVPSAAVAAGVVKMSREMYARTGFVRPWVAYLALVGDECVGTCAFKSPPIDDTVEIAYYTFAGHERRGHATRMARELVALARAASPRVVIKAQTLPEPGASTRILSKLGFAHAGTLTHPDDGVAWEWRLPPSVGV